MNAIGFYTLTKREIVRFMKVWSQTIFPPLITTILYLAIFGFFIGSLMTDINGLDYVTFIIPGLMMLAVINNTYANTSTSIFIMKWWNSIQEILISPLSYFEMAAAFTLGGIARGLITAIVIYLASLLFYPGTIFSIGLFLLIIFLVSVIFSSLGIIIALWGETWDQLGIWTTFIVNPLVFLGGVFHSIKLVPETVQIITKLNPIFYMVDAFRYSMLGVSDGSLGISLAVTTILALGTFSLCVYLFKIGYKVRV